jgi:hypothetical protein
MKRKLQLYLMNDTFTVNKLAQFAEIPSILMKGEMVFSMRTDEELCIICPDFMAPNNIQQDLGWRCIKIEGEFSLDDVGVMVSVLQPLAEANISILATSTFNTDYIFVRDEQLVHAVQALQKARHEFIHKE